MDFVRRGQARRQGDERGVEKLSGGAEGRTRTDLLAEQRLWNTCRESACHFYANGEGQALHYPSCRAKVIEARTKQLQDYHAPE